MTCLAGADEKGELERSQLVRLHWLLFCDAANIVCFALRKKSLDTCPARLLYASTSAINQKVFRTAD